MHRLKINQRWLKFIHNIVNYRFKKRNFKAKRRTPAYSRALVEKLSRDTKWRSQSGCQRNKRMKTEDGFVEDDEASKELN